MEVDKVQTQGCKFPRIGNNGRGSDWGNRIGQKGEEVEQYPDDEDDGGGEVKIGGGGSEMGGVGRLSMWPSSRIVRVSRASGGKDRHSKVLTSKGLRDRRVRLSVTTAIQFYDLQDRLGVDQPSKAVEWLLKAAAKSIDELGPISASFPDTPTKQLSDEKRPTLMDSAEVELGCDLNPNYQQQQQHGSLSKSACSSNSETSKGSGLSLSRSENRVKARERARERRAEKEKEKGSETTTRVSNRPNMNHISQSSFTELLTGGINNVNNSNSSSNNNNGSPNGTCQQFQKTTRHWSSVTAAPMDYFSSGLLSPSTSRQHHLSGFSAQMGGNTLQQQSMTTISPYNHHHPEMQQHFSFVPDQSDYNLNFTISSTGLAHAGLNRGTLQSNSQPSSLLPHLQRLSSPIDGSNVPFFAAQNATPMENHHHQFPDGLDGRLQLCYGDGGGRQSDHKGKGKS
ncbi:hypothetical protein RHMOL_Rhmol13G0149000 [Rhododendron molle]|uniref:Uncharacterized protein n=1 Tax=Rhododendron molle TaxID=49168 RepID=A0ACC0L7A8_RHOML|nr:hypothetical protein RHMOL_Rhmol13G0149000 [Rhododendron molle]